MDIDQKIEWAEKISKELHSVSRNEFRAWIEYFQQKDLNSALEYARRLSQSRMLRKQQKKAFGKIFYGIKKYRNDLCSISDDTITDIFGYVMWGLHIWAEKKITFVRGHSKTVSKNERKREKR